MVMCPTHSCLHTLMHAPSPQHPTMPLLAQDLRPSVWVARGCGDMDMLHTSCIHVCVIPGNGTTAMVVAPAAPQCSTVSTVHLALFVVGAPRVNHLFSTTNRSPCFIYLCCVHSPPFDIMALGRLWPTWMMDFTTDFRETWLLNVRIHTRMRT